MFTGCALRANRNITGEAEVLDRLRAMVQTADGLVGACRHEKSQRSLVEFPQISNSVPLEAVHVLMGHHAVGTEEISTVLTMGHSHAVFAFTSRTGCVVRTGARAIPS